MTPAPQAGIRLKMKAIYASEGEIIHALQTVYGNYTETPVF